MVMGAYRPNDNRLLHKGQEVGGGLPEAAFSNLLLQQLLLLLQCSSLSSVASSWTLHRLSN